LKQYLDGISVNNQVQFFCGGPCNRWLRARRRRRRRRRSEEEEELYLR
jgi:hypothetical protein